MKIEAYGYRLAVVIAGLMAVLLPMGQVMAQVRQYPAEELRRAVGMSSSVLLNFQTFKNYSISLVLDVATEFLYKGLADDPAIEWTGFTVIGGRISSVRFVAPGVLVAPAPPVRLPDRDPSHTSKGMVLLGKTGRCTGPEGEGWCGKMSSKDGRFSTEEAETAARLAAQRLAAEKAAEKAAREAAERARLAAIQAAGPQRVMGHPGEVGYLHFHIIWNSIYSLEAGTALITAKADSSLLERYVACKVYGTGARVAVTARGYSDKWESWMMVTVLDGPLKGCRGAASSADLYDKAP